MLTASAIDPDGTPTDNDIGAAFRNGVMVLGGALLTIDPFGLVGHQNLNFMWSNKERLSLIQDPANLNRFLLQERFPRLGNPDPMLRQILERSSRTCSFPFGP